MKKALLSIGLVFLISSAAFSQQSISSAGNNAAGSGGSSSFTIGQVDYINSSGPAGSVYQGVQQLYEIFTIGILDYNRTNLSLSVFPNPTASFVMLRIEGLETEKLFYQVYDLYGRLIFDQRISQYETLIPMQDLRPATYLLRVSGESEIQLFKVVKNQ